MKNLLNLTLIFTMLLMSSCSSDDSDSTQEPTAIKLILQLNFQMQTQILKSVLLLQMKMESFLMM